MRLVMRVCAAIGFLGVMSTVAWAAASQTPIGPPTVDPQLRNATPSMLSAKVLDQCLVVQSRLMQTTREAVHSACSCYAKATIAQMSRDELEFMRRNGYFDDSARGKAVANLDRCKLQRPAGV